MNKTGIWGLFRCIRWCWAGMLLVPAVAGQGEVLDIGSRREVFVDQYLIERMEGTRLALHRPHDEGPVLKFDKPWEGAFCGYCTVIKDGGKFLFYYRGLAEAGKDYDSQEVTCYAESRDGIHVTKPNLGIFEINGTKNNNVILAGAAPVTHNFCPFLDAHKGVDKAERYKALGGSHESGLLGYVSGDGIHWRKLQEEPLITKGAFDSQNVSFWSESEKCYLCYFRTWSEGYRGISRTTSKDFLHWSEPVEMSYGDTVREQLYTNQTQPYFRAPHIYVATAARFMPGSQILTAEEAERLNVNPGYFKDCSDGVLMSSRGGNSYDRTFTEGFIRPGVGLENWVSRTNYPALNVVQTGPAEMSVYVNHNYAQTSAHLRRYVMRVDGFASVNAPYQGGSMMTKALNFKGNKLLLNFATSAAGSIKIEIQDQEGKPIPGYTLKDCKELVGNFIERKVSWKGGMDVSSLEGREVRLCFEMKDADLYAVQFVP